MFFWRERKRERERERERERKREGRCVGEFVRHTNGTKMFRWKLIGKMIQLALIVQLNSLDFVCLHLEYNNVAFITHFVHKPLHHFAHGTQLFDFIDAMNGATSISM